MKDFHLTDAPVFIDHGFHHDFSLGWIEPSRGGVAFQFFHTTYNRFREPPEVWLVGAFVGAGEMAAICVRAGAWSDCAVCPRIADGSPADAVSTADSAEAAIGASAGFTMDVASATIGSTVSCLLGSAGCVV